MDDERALVQIDAGVQRGDAPVEGPGARWNGDLVGTVKSLPPTVALLSWRLRRELGRGVGN